MRLKINFITAIIFSGFSLKIYSTETNQPIESQSQSKTKITITYNKVDISNSSTNAEAAITINKNDNNTKVNTNIENNIDIITNTSSGGIKIDEGSTLKSNGNVSIKNISNKSALESTKNSKIDINGNLSINSNNGTSIVANQEGTINITGKTNIDSTSKYTVNAIQGAIINLNDDANIKSKSKKSSAIQSNALSSEKTSINLNGNSVIEVNGDESDGIFVQRGGNLTSTKNIKIVTNGSESNAVHADNINEPEENKISFNNINITLNGKKSNGLKSKEKSIINVSGLATIKSNKDDSAAISSERKESRIFINKVDIEISGDDSNAIVGTKNYNQKAEYNIKINNGKIISTGNNSNIIHGHGTNIFIGNSKLSAKNGNLISLDGSSYINISKSTINAKNAVVDIMGENEGNISNVILNNVKQENTNQDINLINAKGNSELQLTLTNGTQVSGGALKENTATTHITMNNNSQWNLTKVSNISNLNLDNSQLNFAPPTAKNFLTLDIDKNLTSKNGKFVMNTTLNNDLSPTDKLIIKGNTSGTEGIIINNINGKGESTVNGIELIQVNGNSSGEFKLANRAVAGAYDYTLQRGGHTKATSNKNWYLTNVLIKTREKSPHQFNPTENEIESTTPIYRPEFGSYIKNIQAANTLFHMTLHDRLGETRYTDALTMEHKVTSMWIRGVIGRNRARMGDDQLRSQANRSVIQIGGDLAQWSANECNRYHLGGMVGYANHRSDTASNITGSGSIGRTVGYSAGLYGTWYSNQSDQTGLYVDSWALYNWFDNETHGDFQHNEKYKSRGATISAESSYTFKIYQYLSQNNLLNKFYIQPQAQITWMGVKAKTHIDKNGTKIASYGQDNIQTRLSIRVYLKGKSITDKDKNRKFEPFIETNWLHNSKKYGAMMDTTPISIDGSRHIFELKLGIEAKINNNLNLWGNFSQQLGNKEYSDTQAILGVKYLF